MSKNTIQSGILSLLLCLFIACDKPVNPESATPESRPKPDDPLVHELNEIIHPLNSTIPTQSDSDLNALSFLGNCSVVGLGEATHGTSEFFQLKHRIFKYLVEHHGFRALAMEADMGESIYIDRYITRGEGDLDELMRNTMYFLIWQTEEFRDFLEWMRNYNTDKPEQEKIHYIGLDCQLLIYQIPLIKNYFQKTMPEFLTKILPTLDIFPISDGISDQKIEQFYASMNYSQYEAISDSLSNILIDLRQIEDQLIALTSRFEFQTIYQLVRNMQQAHDVIYAGARGGALRDKYMAENVLWIYRLFTTRPHIAVWAHNQHVANKENLYGSKSSMGNWLRKILGDNYQIVGFSFSGGSFRAVKTNQSGTSYSFNVQHISTDPPKESINYLFHQARYDHFYLILSEMPTTADLKNWLSTSRPFLSIGAYFSGSPADHYSLATLDEFFNVIIHWDQTTASELLAP